MAKDVEPTEGEAEAAAREYKPPESEVRPEEFLAGIGPQYSDSPLGPEAVAELEKPLDPNRVRRREGRGTAQFEYLAGHDVLRRATEVFGFGNWGTRVVELREISAVAVTSRSNKEGWHLGYLAIVEVNVKGCQSFQDVGYGDAVEYGPAALVTARELASKEAVTDAIKRAFRAWGDQFGLILYAKDDEVRRIEADAQARETERERAIVRERTFAVPESWGELAQSIQVYDEGTWAAFSEFGAQLREHLGDVSKDVLWQKTMGAALWLRDRIDPDRFPPPSRAEMQAAFGSRAQGHVFDGPAWRMGPEEQDRPVREADSVPADLADVPFGPTTDAETATEGEGGAEATPKPKGRQKAGGA